MRRVAFVQAAKRSPLATGGHACACHQPSKNLEARVGFEPTSDGFADHSLGPLGYRALFVMPKIYAQSYAQRALFLPIHAVERLANLLIPHDAGLAEGPLPRATWVPRQTSKYSKILAGARKLAARSARTPRYFFVGATGDAILASRRKRADSSGGVGLM
jgi:hypothetical protein